MIRSTKDWNKWRDFIDGGTDSVSGRVLTSQSNVDTGRSYRFIEFPVNENDQVIFNVMAKLVTGSVKPAIDFFNSAGTKLNTDFYELESDDWEQVTVKSTAPRNSVFCRVICGVWQADIGEGMFHSPEIIHSNAYQFQTFFTPEIKGRTNAGSFSYTKQDGRATVINGYCFFNIRIDFNGVSGSPSGDTIITLPFVCADIPTSGSGNHFAVNIGIASRIPLPVGYTQLLASVRTGLNEIYLEALGDEQPFARIQAESFPTASSVFISLSGFYEIEQ